MPPPCGKPAAAFFNVIARASRAHSSAVTSGAMRKPPMEGPRATLSTTSTPSSPRLFSCTWMVFAGPRSSANGRSPAMPPRPSSHARARRDSPSNSMDITPHLLAHRTSASATSVPFREERQIRRLRSGSGDRLRRRCPTRGASARRGCSATTSSRTSMAASHARIRNRAMPRPVRRSPCPRAHQSKGRLRRPATQGEPPPALPSSPAPPS